MSRRSDKEINQVQRRLQQIAQGSPRHRGSNSDLTPDLRARLEKKQRLKSQLRRAEQDRRRAEQDRRHILRSLAETEDDLVVARQKERVEQAAAASSAREARAARPSSSGRESRKRSPDRSLPVSRQQIPSIEGSSRQATAGQSPQSLPHSISISQQQSVSVSQQQQQQQQQRVSESSSEEGSKSSSEDEQERVRTEPSKKTTEKAAADSQSHRRDHKGASSRSTTPSRHLSPGDRDHRRSTYSPPRRHQREETACPQASPTACPQASPTHQQQQEQPQGRPRTAWSKLHHKSESVPNLLPDLLDATSCRQILATQTQDFEAIFLFQQLRFYRKLIRAYTDPPLGLNPTPDLHPPNSNSS